MAPIAQLLVLLYDHESTVPWVSMHVRPDLVTHSMLAFSYPGAGTAEDPYRFCFLDRDVGDPLHFSTPLQ